MPNLNKILTQNNTLSKGMKANNQSTFGRNQTKKLSSAPLPYFEQHLKGKFFM